MESIGNRACILIASSDPASLQGFRMIVLGASLLDIPWVYRLWQAPFAEKKLAPIWEHFDSEAISRVLDVGCGPGTNAHHFSEYDYVGLDINPAYVRRARERHDMVFKVADLTREKVIEEPFDFILVNSFLHHIGDRNADYILAQLAGLLRPEGSIHVLELVLPERRSLSRLLARLDRGDHPRPLLDWQELLQRHFMAHVFEPYELQLLGLPLWKMIYFKGGTK